MFKTTQPGWLCYFQRAGNTSTVNAKGSYSVIDGSTPMKNSAVTNSELFYHRSLTVNHNTIALSSDRGSLEIAGVSLLYEGSRVKSFLLGRDLNPMGRGDGSLYAQGMFRQTLLRLRVANSLLFGFGNSINNGCGLPWDKDHGASADCIYSDNHIVCYPFSPIPWPHNPPPDLGYGEFVSPCNLLSYSYQPVDGKWRVGCIYDPTCPYTEGFVTRDFQHWLGCSNEIPTDSPPSGYGQFPMLGDSIKLCSGCKHGGHTPPRCHCLEKGDIIKTWDEIKYSNLSASSCTSCGSKSRYGELSYGNIALNCHRKIAEAVEQARKCIEDYSLQCGGVYPWLDILLDCAYDKLLTLNFVCAKPDDCCFSIMGFPFKCCGHNRYIALNCLYGKVLLCPEWSQLSLFDRVETVLHEALHSCGVFTGDRAWPQVGAETIAQAVMDCCGI